MIRTLIAEQSALIRGGLSAVLTHERDIEVVAELERPEDVLPTARSVRPDVVLVDADIAGTDGFHTIRKLHATVPSCRSLIMASERNPAELRDAVSAQASGFVLKDTSADQLRDAIRRVATGKKALDPDLAFATLKAEPNPLTRSEIDALRLAAQGSPTGEIAKALYLSAGTVRNYVSRAICKTGARNRIDAIRIAEASGWL